MYDYCWRRADIILGWKIQYVEQNQTKVRTNAFAPMGAWIVKFVDNNPSLENLKLSEALVPQIEPQNMH